MILFLYIFVMACVIYLKFDVTWSMTVIGALGFLGAYISWLYWKDRVEKLEEEVEKLKRSDNNGRLQDESNTR